MYKTFRYSLEERNRTYSVILSNYVFRYSARTGKISFVSLRSILGYISSDRTLQESQSDGDDVVCYRIYMLRAGSFESGNLSADP